MTENVVNPPINNDPMEKRNELFDHPSYMSSTSASTEQTYQYPLGCLNINERQEIPQVIMKTDHFSALSRQREPNIELLPSDSSKIDKPEDCATENENQLILL